jgi:hypothetical protein
MPRFVPAVLLVLALVGACAPAGAIEPPLASVSPATSATAARTPTAAPSVPPALDPASPAAASPSPREVPPNPGTATASPPSAGPSPTPIDRPSAGPFAVNLAQVADFVPQYTFEWCVGASLQMTRSIITGKRTESRRSQRRLWEMARDLTVGSPYGGANPAGWAAALNEMKLGPYRLVSLPTFDAAVRRAARAVAATGRPVGLVMWAGRHAWVMTGFEATGDLRRNGDARVTRVRVMDPLYPHGSRWGPSPAPNRLVRLETLARQFVMRDRPDYDFGVEPGWLLVLPVR